MYKQLKENIIHGTKENPFVQYNMLNIGHEFQIPVHWHDEIEIIFIEKGKLFIKISDNEYWGQPGDVFFINSKELHLMGSKTGEVEYHTFLFPLDYICFRTEDLIETEIMDKLRSMYMVFPNTILDKNVKEKTYNLLQSIYKIKRLSGESILKQLRIKIILLEILLILKENNVFIQNQDFNKTQMQKELIEYINAHYTEKLTLAMVAKEFHLSEKYASRYFAENFHLGFSNYVIHLRLEHAKRLLDTTDEQITQIAMLSGFSTVSYFIRTFKSSYGMSPLKYRKRYNKD